jgi:signal transduction histidine kinase
VQARTAELQVAFEELRHTQDELVRKEKLASLGALVAGMAHELNTPIGNAVIVASTLADLRQQFDVEVARGLRRSVLSRFTADVAEAVDVMERNLRRAAELIAGFKQVAVDQSSHQRRPFELSEVVHELHLALSPTLRRRGVQWVEQVPAGLQMDSYPGPLSQVLMNIVNNAVTHAFDQQASPRIAVRAEPVSDTHIQITLHDNGCGIAPEHQQRVFDPFFTTRLGRGGSGLGMHIVYSLVTGLLGGRVHLDSTPGHGCTLTLTLPRTAPVATTPLPTS